MTGLILKDLLVMRKALKSYLMIMVLYAVLAYLDVLNYSFIITFIQVMLMVLPLSAFAYDEQAKWDRYAMSLPLGRVRVVGARYLFVLALCSGDRRPRGCWVRSCCTWSSRQIGWRCWSPCRSPPPSGC